MNCIDFKLFAMHLFTNYVAHRLFSSTIFPFSHCTGKQHDRNKIKMASPVFALLNIVLKKWIDFENTDFYPQPYNRVARCGRSARIWNRQMIAVMGLCVDAIVTMNVYGNVIMRLDLINKTGTIFILRMKSVQDEHMGLNFFNLLCVHFLLANFEARNTQTN